MTIAALGSHRATGRTISEQFLVDFFGDALAMGGILSIDDRHLCPVPALQFKQMLLQHPPADLSNDISDK